MVMLMLMSRVAAASVWLLLLLLLLLLLPCITDVSLHRASACCCPGGVHCLMSCWLRFSAATTRGICGGGR